MSIPLPHQRGLRNGQIAGWLLEQADHSRKTINEEAMKRFKLQCGMTIKVDDEDAYLLRSYVWRSKPHLQKNGITYYTVIRGGTGEHPNLARTIIGDEFEVVYHVNGDQTDYTRKNLRGSSRDEWMELVVAPKMSASMVKYNATRRNPSEH